MINFNRQKIEEYKTRFLAYSDEEYLNNLQGKISLVAQRYLDKLTEDQLYIWLDHNIKQYEETQGADDQVKFVLASTLSSLLEPQLRLFHGSPVGDIDKLEPRESNHKKKYVYTTDCYALAVLYSYNPIERPGGFYTYRFDKEGNLIYDEYFPNQLEKMYKGHAGYIYEMRRTEFFNSLEKMPWIYVSTRKTDVYKPKHIPDIYKEILKLEKSGQIVINRYENMTEAEREKWRNIVIKDIEMKELKDDIDSSYAQFLHENIPDLI